MKIYIVMAAILFLCLNGDWLYATGIVVENGGKITLNNETIALECQDITIKTGGSIDLNTGLINHCRHFLINPGATLVDAFGTITLCGTWQNNSSFTQGSNSTIGFVTGCGVQNNANGSGDTDNDGVSDKNETFLDSNNDGLPDFLDTSIAVVNWRPPIPPLIYLLLRND